MELDARCAIDPTLVGEAIRNHEQAIQHADDGLLVEAEACSREALRIFESLFGTVHPDVAIVLGELGAILAAGHQWTSAERCLSRSISIAEELSGIMDPNELALLLTENLALLGTALRAMGRYRDAEQPLLRALELARAPGEPPAVLLKACNNLGVLYKYTGQFDEAEQLYSEALSLAQHSGGEMSTDVATLYHNIGGLEHARGRFGRGLEPARKAYEIRKELLGENDPATLSDACALAGILDGLGRYSESLPIYADALEAYQRLYGPEHYEIAVVLNNIAAVEHAEHRLVGAEQMYRRALQMKVRLLGDQHPDTALTMYNLAMLLHDRGARDEAHNLGARALELMSATYTEPHPHLDACRALVSGSPNS